MRVYRAAAMLAFCVGCSEASRSDLRQMGGTLDIQPPQVDFGDVALGREDSHTVALQNTGIVPMTVTQLPGFEDPAFVVSGLPVTLASGQAARIAVRYRPPDLGTHRGALELASDSPEDPRADVALLGHAVRGLATLSGDSFDFGNVVVNETASQQFSLLNNDGHAVTSVAIAPPQGADSSAFIVAKQGQLEMMPDQSLAVEVDFRPGRLGAFSAVVQVTPCPTCSPRNLTFSGRGVESLLVIDPPNLDFGAVHLAAGADLPFTATNISKSPLVMKAPALSGSAAFSATTRNATLPYTMAPGEIVNGIAHFGPHELGTQNGTASFGASDGAPGVLAMTGTGVGPVLQVTPRSLFVGAAALQTTRTAFVTVTNVGLDPKQDSPLVIRNVSVVSSDPAWSLQTSTPLLVGEPGSSAAIRFSFTPQQTGPSQMTLVIDSNDAMHAEIQVPIAASGRDLLPCTLRVAPGNPVDFGQVKLFQPTVQGFELTNTTNDDCIVGDPDLTGGPAFRWPGGIAPAGRTLPPGGRMSVRVELVAESVQAYSGAVTFYVSNKSAPTMTVQLIGGGDDSCFFVSPGTVDFGATTLGCGAQRQNLYAVNQCDHFVRVTGAAASGPPFTAAAQLPFDLAPQTSHPIPIVYAPQTPGDDVGQIYVTSSESPIARAAGLTGGARNASTVFDQWDQSTPKVDMLIVIDNSGSMAEEQKALAANLDHLWNRIALANADFHIAVTSSGMTPYTSGWTQCPGGANGGEAGRFFPVDASRPRILTPETAGVKDALFANTNVGTCHWDERFLDPVIAALTDPLVSSTKAPGTPWPSDGNAGFLRDDARLALLAVTDTDDDVDLVNPPPVSDSVTKLIAIKHGARDLISFAGIVPLSVCPTSELPSGDARRFKEIAAQLNGHLYDVCNLNGFGAMLESSLGDLLQPLSSFPLSAHPKDPSAIVVTVNGVVSSDWSYDAAANRIVFGAGAVPAPGAHVTAKYEAACQ